MNASRTWMFLVGILVGSPACHSGDVCYDSDPAPLPTGSFTPFDAPIAALLTGTVTIDEGSVTVVYVDDTGATWTVVYAITG